MLITLALDVEELEDLINGLLQAGLVMSAEELEKALLQLLKKNILQSIELSWMRELALECSTDPEDIEADNLMDAIWESKMELKELGYAGWEDL
ncbi:MAG: hypothetical protein [Bacteriophage sp.]|nr:MAG: hypothetical protein [Bacteriophage sp.]